VPVRNPSTQEVEATGLHSKTVSKQKHNKKKQRQQKNKIKHLEEEKRTQIQKHLVKQPINKNLKH
jgi:hypothetical protein